MELREQVALALLNSDRAMAGFPPVETRDNIPDSGGYLVNADAAIAAVLDAMPDEIDLFRILRRAGRKDADKARAIDAMLAAFRAEALERR